MFFICSSDQRLCQEEMDIPGHHQEYTQHLGRMEDGEDQVKYHLELHSLEERMLTYEYYPYLYWF